MILRYDLKKVDPFDAPFMSADAVAFLNKSGLTKLGSALRCQWAMSDPAFRKPAQLVWDRSPKMRTLGGLAEMAGRWARIDPIVRDAVLGGLLAVESGDGDKAEAHRQLIIDFAGEEYYIKRQ
ncbi:MAG: hypothetical protein C0467_31490 [Planctomycetaceae bacterium]|nr:hypothetical protein [Planctomycetaceae bacterium]